MTYDSNQRFVQFVGGGNGAIYAIQADGVLYWYRHSGWLTGAGTWTQGSGVVLGNGFQQFRTVMAAADGQLFCVTQDGTVKWYKWVLSDPNLGFGSWHPNSGSVIATGWNAYPQVFGGWDGVFYAIDNAGKMRWFKYLAGNGTNGAGAWHANSGAAISQGGWKRYLHYWSDPNGVIFADQQGDFLHWYRYLAGDGTAGPTAWANGGTPVEISAYFGDEGQKAWFSNTNGTIYTVMVDVSTTPGLDNQLWWYRLQDSENIVLGGNNRWYNSGAGSLIGSGFTVERCASLHGYPSEISPVAGAHQGFRVSSTFDTVQCTVDRLAATGAPAGQVWGPFTAPGRVQLLAGGYRQNGCGWSEDFSLTIPATWPSGLYTARLTGLLGGTAHLKWDIPFVVRPAAPTAPIAVLLPTNTYQAYNQWGGHNQYTAGQNGVQRTVTLFRPNYQTWTTDQQKLSHTMYSDLLLLQWMAANNIPFDLYQDGDLHVNGAWLSHYKGLVLGSHPEYWTETMRTNVLNYSTAGGRVICTGGNAIFEKMAYSTSGTAIVFRAPNGDRWEFVGFGEGEDQVLGTLYNSNQWLNFAPYQVMMDHPFLAGTGLAVGDTFGKASYNGAGASGWEIDRVTGGNPAVKLIARGLNGGGPNGADMTYWDRGNGGWVFNTSSIAFNGALALEPTVSTILHNVLTAAMA